MLIKADNFHALNLLQEKYRQSVTCIYIDPPYNTSASEIIYKNGYKDSSWLSLIYDRLTEAIKLVDSETVIAIAIDDYALVKLCEMCDENFPMYERNLVIVNHHPQGSGGKNISRTHEYMIYLIPKGLDLLRGKEKTAGKELRSFMLSGPGENKSRDGRPNSFYALVIDEKNKKIERIEKPPKKGETFNNSKTDDGYKRMYPIGNGGREQVWCRSYEGALKALENNEILVTDNLSIKLVVDTTSKRSILFSNWVNSKYNAGPHGTKLVADILGNAELFSYPKSIHLVEDSIDAMSWHMENPTVLDFFAGSATTAHAVINLNREDGGTRKYILVETNEYFDSVTLPRVKKVIYSKVWKDGKPVSREGSPHLLKYFALESYEDAMNNLELNQKDELEDAKLQFSPEFQEDYLLNYSLEFETQGSQSLLNLDNFAAPFDYKMKIAVNGVGETQETPVDLVETFNYLIGLYVEKIQQIDGFRVVRGKTRTGERCLILWRTTKDLKQVLADKRLNDFLEKQAFDFSEIDTLYINGDAAIPIGNVRTENAVWQIKMIEAEFLKRMFE